VLYDVAVLGGGPSGAASSLSLKQVEPALRVLLVEATGYDKVRAGETLAPGGQAVLEALGCWQQFRQEGFLESHGTAALWGGATIHENEFLLSGRGSAWHLDRSYFDAMLSKCALDAGVEVMRGTRFLDGSREGGIWRLRLQTGQDVRCVDAGFVIDATGRAARFAIRQGARRLTEDRLVGVSVIYRFSGDVMPRDRAILVEASANGWWYSAPLPGSRLVVAWMSDSDLLPSASLRHSEIWARHLATAGPTSERVAGGTAEAAPRIWAACTQHLSVMQGDGWVATGDAACAWDPLSAAGILKALRNGRVAGFVARDHGLGRPDHAARYTHFVQREHADYRFARAWFYGQEGRWRSARFWARRCLPPRQHASEDEGPQPWVLRGCCRPRPDS
jgi:flavin-dependent dehydrogenase